MRSLSDTIGNPGHSDQRQNVWNADDDSEEYHRVSGNVDHAGGGTFALSAVSMAAASAVSTVNTSSMAAWISGVIALASAASSSAFFAAYKAMSEPVRELLAFTTESASWIVAIFGTP
jgi:hypothetical protein